jgi:hypothetical protein
MARRYGPPSSETIQVADNGVHTRHGNAPSRFCTTDDRDGSAHRPRSERDRSAQRTTETRPRRRSAAFRAGGRAFPKTSGHTTGLTVAGRATIPPDSPTIPDAAAACPTGRASARATRQRRGFPVLVRSRPGPRSARAISVARRQDRRASPDSRSAASCRRGPGRCGCYATVPCRPCRYAPATPASCSVPYPSPADWRSARSGTQFCPSATIR